LSNGTVMATGGNESGQLGLGNNTLINVPTVLPGVSGISALVAGGEHTLFVQGGAATTGNVSGIIALQGIVSGAPPQTVTFTFTPTSGTPTVKTANIGSSGTYSLSDIPAGTYSVRIKGAKYLAKVVAVTVTAGGTATVNATLKAGDANDDNAADIGDLLLLISAYNKVSPNTGYLEAADFNSDGSDDIADLLLLIGNYNQIGS